jgi:hypothetical protein
MEPQNSSATPPVKVPKDEVKPLKVPKDEVKPLDQNIELKRKWYALSPRQKQAAIYSMSPDQVNTLYDNLRPMGDANTTFESKGAEFKKAPEWKGMFDPESVQYLREKAQSMMDWGQENLSNIAGPVGAHVGEPVGFALGEAIAPEGGGIPGAKIGEVTGATVAGSGAEIVRQLLEHLEGRDQYKEDWEKTPRERMKRIIEAGGDQGVAQAFGMAFNDLLRPTLKRSIKNLYEAGMFDYGDPKAEKTLLGTGRNYYKSGGQLESVIKDVMKADEANTKAYGKAGKQARGQMLKPAITIEDFSKTMEGLQNEIGKEVADKMNLPINQGGKLVPLKDAVPNPTPLVDLIETFETKDPLIVHRASLAGTDPKVISAKKYIKAVKARKLTFQQQPFTYGLLAKERQDINRELAEYYKLTDDGKSEFLKNHPLFEVDKAIADYIRKTTYPEMDRLSGQPLGTTAELQGKYGALKNLNDQMQKRIQKLATDSRTGTTPGMNVGTYATSSGIGAAGHRLPLKVGESDVEAEANRKVSRAFGHSLESKVRKHLLTKPLGSKVLGSNILSIPVRALIYMDDTRPTPQPPADQDDDDAPEPQSSVTQSPKELLQKAKSLNPAAVGQTAYNHTAVNPATGHRIKSSDGRVWYDEQTGQQVA